MKTRHKNNGHEYDPNFNLDAYLKEQAEEQEAVEQESPKRPGRFKRIYNTTVFILTAALIVVLANYDWNPLKAYEGIFGVEEDAPAVIAGVNPTAGTQVTNPPLPPIPPLPDVSAFERSAAEFERSAEAFANAEEIERFTEQTVRFAMESAQRALETLNEGGLQELQDINGQEALQKLKVLEDLNLEGLELLGDLDLGNITVVQNNVTEAFPSSLQNYTDALNDRSITQFSEEEIKELFDNKVTIQYLIDLRTAGVLKDLKADDIIKFVNN